MKQVPLSEAEKEARSIQLCIPCPTFCHEADQCETCADYYKRILLIIQKAEERGREDRDCPKCKMEGFKLGRNQGLLKGAEIAGSELNNQTQYFKLNGDKLILGVLERQRDEIATAIRAEIEQGDPYIDKLKTQEALLEEVGEALKESGRKLGSIVLEIEQAPNIVRVATKNTRALIQEALTKLQQHKEKKNEN